MGTYSGAPGAKVMFPEEAWRTDTQHLATDAKALAEATRHRLEAFGLHAADRKPCDAESADGTALPGCFKTYLGPKQKGHDSGAWGMVFQVAIQDGQPVLVYLAFGLRHPAPLTRPSVYQLAHRRLHGR
ncbi:MAG: hypothetical protein JHD16_00085 [Solirubrobacteraceae bacterium]|nr:hypothetical protein [Solirubrobacteraceae bacterium]